MDAVVTGTVGRLTYSRVRQLVLMAGLAVVLLTAAVMFARRVETVEVVGTLLYIPILIAFIFGGIRGGLAAGVGAAVLYVLMRSPAIDTVGLDRFSGLLISRSLAFIAFGAVGGWASRQLDASVTKLELYDQIDDTTGLYNARFFVEAVDLETSRAQRYRTLFSVAVVDLPVAYLEPMGARQKKRMLRDLGRLLKESVRTVDRAIHAADETSHRFALVLPETADEGARIFVARLADSIAELVSHRGGTLGHTGLATRTATHPGSDVELFAALREEFSNISQRAYPDRRPA